MSRLSQHPDGRYRRPRHGIATAVVAGIVVMLPTSAHSASIGTVSGTTAASTVRVGSVTLSSCGSGLPGWCGSIPVPLDWQAPSSAGDPSIKVGFEWLPATGTAIGTIVTVEGGPGFASTGSQSQYAAMVGPLSSNHNTLVFDLRGTGRSTPINCAALQKFHGVASGASFATLVGDCGTKLNQTWKNSAGDWVHASDQFTTANAARDLHAALGQLNLTGVDLYGDSYGSWFAQAFASRYPGDLRSVTLDASYPVLGLDPWSADIKTTAEHAVDAVCTRSPACAQRTTGVAWDDIGALAATLRQSPAHGTTVDLNDNKVSQTVDVRTLIDLINNAGFDPAVYSQLDAAALAYVDAGDSAPLLRLAAWSVGNDNTNPTQASAYSDGLYFATVCTDYTQLFDMSASPATRAQQLTAAVAAEPTDTFAPFTPAEWITMNAYNGAYDACLDWPAPASADPPLTSSPPLVPPTLPVLVLSGDLDSTTPPDGNATVARQLGTSARYVEVPNVTHVTAMPNLTWPGTERCGETLYRQFVADPAALATLDTTCTQQTWPVAVVGSFPSTLAAVPTPTATSGNDAAADGLRATATGVSVVADAIARQGFINGSSDDGLRGGSWSNSSSGATLKFTFTADRWVADASVAGDATWNQTSGAVKAKLTITYDDDKTATVTVEWNTQQTLTPVQVNGTANGKSLAATMPAP